MLRYNIPEDRQFAISKIAMLPVDKLIQSELKYNESLKKEFVSVRKQVEKIAERRQIVLPMMRR